MRTTAVLAPILGMLSMAGTAHGGDVAIEAGAAKWKPVSVSAAADPQSLGNRFSRRGRSPGSEYPTGVQVSRRVYPGRKGRLVVFSVFPAALKKLRKHLELRCLVDDGILDEVSIVAVSVDRTAAAKNLDSVQLRGKGISYEEEPAAGGRVYFAALSDESNASAFSAGEVKAARFSDPALGVVSFAFSLGGRLKAPPSYDAALAAKLADEGFTLYEGPFGSYLQIPPGYTASSVAAEHAGGMGVLFHPKGTAADPSLPEAVGRKAVYFFSTSGEETFTPPAGKRSNFLALSGLFRDGP
ncbi:MAG: hypothetical protein HZB91_07230 [Elusimicrobia bacterium]|nr:hypothetical protein [Elusimicrobiota bacterium]